MHFGFVKVATAIPSVEVANCQKNAARIIEQIEEADKNGVEILCFPELSITGYTCGDLFLQETLRCSAMEAMEEIVAATLEKNMTVIVGMPLEIDGLLYNVAVVINSGEIAGIVPKTYLPNYNEFYEMRWFASADTLKVDKTDVLGFFDIPVGTRMLFYQTNFTFAVELCEDLWAPVPPSSLSTMAGAEIVFNLSATNECIGKHAYLCSLISQQSARCLSGYVYSSCGFGESTTDVVFAGNAMVYENGTLLAQGERFSMEPQIVYAEVDVDRIRVERRRNTTFGANRRLMADKLNFKKVTAKIYSDNRSNYSIDITRSFDPHPFVPKGEALNERCQEIFDIQVAGLCKRLVHTHARTAVVGISGGLDSTLALLVCVKAFDKLGRDRSEIVGVTMPGFGTTDRTYHNAISLMKSLGVTVREVSIAKAVTQHFSDIGHDAAVHDVTYENSQARERTQILMDIANQTWGIVIGTGDLSELALGWATYNGDHMSMYGVNCSIPKTLVKHLVQWVAENGVDSESRATLLDIVDTPISPELIPADENGNIKQKTEDLVGPYELHDFFLYHALRYGFTPDKIFLMACSAFAGVYDKPTIMKWLATFYRRFFAQQFKRSCLPDGPKVGSISLSPRGDWRMPSDASVAEWMRVVEEDIPNNMDMFK